MTDDKLKELGQDPDDPAFTRPARRLLTEAEAKARDEELRAAGITVEHPTTSTITLLKRPAAATEDAS